VIQNVEEFGAELGRKPLFYRPILEQGKIPIAKAGVAEDIPTLCSEGTEWRWPPSVFLEDQLQAQLYSTGAAATEDWVRCRLVRRYARTTEI
jgi:hypothetical protein